VSTHSPLSHSYHLATLTCMCAADTPVCVCVVCRAHSQRPLPWHAALVCNKSDYARVCVSWYVGQEDIRSTNRALHNTNRALHNTNRALHSTNRALHSTSKIPVWAQGQQRWLLVRAFWAAGCSPMPFLTRLGIATSSRSVLDTCPCPATPCVCLLALRHGFAPKDRGLNLRLRETEKRSSLL
jgi:hypothetical protein